MKALCANLDSLAGPAHPQVLGWKKALCAGKRGRRAAQESARRAAQSDMVRDLAAELAGAPEEVRKLLSMKGDNLLVLGGNDSSFAIEEIIRGLAAELAGAPEEVGTLPLGCFKKRASPVNIQEEATFGVEWLTPWSWSTVDCARLQD